MIILILNSNSSYTYNVLEEIRYFAVNYNLAVMKRSLVSIEIKVYIQICIPNH